MTIDSKKSSDTCYYLYSSYVCSAKNTDLKFHLEQYGKPVSELKDNDMATQKEDLSLIHILTRLRKKLEEIGLCEFIKTRKGIGYQIREEQVR